MAENCAPLAGAISLDPSCEALRAKGGVRKRMYVGSIADVLSHSIDPVTKELKTLVLRTGKKLIKAVSLKEKNVATHNVEQTENSGARFPWTVVFPAYIRTQLERENFLLALANAEDLFVIVELAAGKFEAYGLLGAGNLLGEGGKITGAGTTGTVATDANNMVVTFAGTEDTPPVFVAFGADLAADITYLEGKLTAAA